MNPNSPNASREQPSQDTPHVSPAPVTQASADKESPVAPNPDFEASNSRRPPAPRSARDLMYYRIKEEEKGPYTREQLSTMWRNGQITADAFCRLDQTSTWIPMIEEFAGKSLPV